MRTAVIVLALVAALAVTAQADQFDSYVKLYSRRYSSGAEYEYRRSVFYDNLRIIDAQNTLVRSRGESTKFNVTLFADLTHDEFAATHLGYKPQRNGPQPTFEHKADTVTPNPTSVDWREKGCITAVKNQAQCGSCWAFSATETVESFWNLGGHQLVDLSPQQVTACTTGSDGCDGGYTSAAFEYIQSAGLESAAAYPYTAGNGNTGPCLYKRDDVVARITGWTYAAQNGDESALQNAVATVGPISICVDASTWQFYSGGVLQSNCGQQLDHCVQLVGYNKNGDTPYYIVRNSWTASWGIEGYIWVEMNDGDLCGIANDATYVTV